MTTPSSKLPNLTIEAEDFISTLERLDGPPLYTLTPVEARKFLSDLQKDTHKNIDADVEDKIINTEKGGEVDIRVIRPKGNKNEKLPAIIYVHGGGWVMGDKEIFDVLVKKIANCVNATVIFVNYSRSPEAKYPIAINQIYGTLDYVVKHSDEFNIDPERIAIAGDSAGGNMATVTAIKAKEECGPKLLMQVLFYPVTNADMDTESYESFQDGPWLSRKAMEWFWDAYVSNEEAKDEIYVSPLKASVEDLADLPMTLIITDENDVLRDEGEAYARKLDEAGVKVINVRINGAFHDFLMLNALSETEAAKGAIAISCKMLHNALYK